MSDKPQFYRKSDHVCRLCFGRIFAYQNAEGEHWVECSNCGQAKKSSRVESICACGYKLRIPKTHISKWPNAKFRCRVNPHKTPEMPSEIIVIHIGDDDDRQAEIGKDRP